MEKAVTAARLFMSAVSSDYSPAAAVETIFRMAFLSRCEPCNLSCVSLSLFSYMWCTGGIHCIKLPLCAQTDKPEVPHFIES